MIEILYELLPEHVATCNHCVNTRNLYPEETHFNILEEQYIENFDTATLQQLLEFDFMFGFSPVYQVKTIVRAYQLWTNSVEPFIVPKFESWIGLQIKMLFECKKSNIVSNCLKMNYCELLLAIEELFGINTVIYAIREKHIFNTFYYAIANAHEEITQLVIDRYNPLIDSSIIESAIRVGNLNIIKLVMPLYPKYVDNLADFKFNSVDILRHISWPVFMYLVENQYLNLQKYIFEELVLIAIYSVDEIQILDYIFGKFSPNVNTDIDTIVRTALFQSKYQMAEYICNHCNHSISTHLRKVALVHKAIQSGNRDFVIFLARNGVIFDDQVLDYVIETNNVNISPAFIMSLIAK